MRAVEPGGGITTAPTLLHLLQQATAAADRTDLIEPVTAAATPQQPSAARDTDPQAQALRRRNMLIGGGIAAAVLVLVLILLATFLGRVFGGGGESSLKGDQLGLNKPTPSATAVPTGSVVKPVAATVFSPDGGADAPNLAGLAIDGDPATVWPTDTYSDTVPFPNFKNGVGLMLELPGPTEVGSVTVGVSSTGTQVQIRSADSASPDTLEDTTLLTGPTLLKSGTNTIEVPAASPTSYLLVWISTLGQTGGKNRTDVSEITVRSAS